MSNGSSEGFMGQGGSQESELELFCKTYGVISQSLITDLARASENDPTLIGEMRGFLSSTGIVGNRVNQAKVERAIKKRVGRKLSRVESFARKNGN